MEARARDMSPHNILAAVERLSLPELEWFVSQVIALHASRRAARLSADETAMFKRISQTLPEATKGRLQTLIAKRETEDLSAAEYKELIMLTDQLEVLQADRLAALADLAQLRGTTLSSVMEQLGMHFPDHD